MNAEFFVETLQSNKIVGWGWVPESPEIRLDISVLVNGEFAGRLRCDLPREDLRDAGKGDGNYGMEFEFETPVEVSRDEVVIVSQQCGEIFRQAPKRTKSAKSSKAKARVGKAAVALQNVADVVSAIHKEGDDYEIAIDQIEEQRIIGWYQKKESGGTAVFSGGAGLLIKINDETVAQVEANLTRDDVQKAGKGSPQCGFDVSLPMALNPRDKLELCDVEAERALLTAYYFPDEADNQDGSEPDEQDSSAIVLEEEGGGVDESEHDSRKAIVSAVEPFLDLNFHTMRQGLIDEAMVAQKRAQLLGDLGGASGQDLTNKLIDILANLKAEVQYLKAAYLETSQYKDPEFKIKTPTVPKRIKPDVLEVDMRGEITGGNWYHAEPDGRWAGPENYSSILVPSLNPGHYDLQIYVVGEIEPGIIQGTQLSINGKDIEIEDADIAIPGVLKARFTVDEGYRFPFWSLKMRFPKLVSPTKFGVPDKRVLAIRVQSIRFAKVVEA